MRKYLGKVDKVKLDKLMSISRRLSALKDLEFTLKDLDGDYSIADHSNIDAESIKKEISGLVVEKERTREEIRLQNGWTEEDMARIHLMANYKAFMDIEPGK
jgi:hypothetical protein